MAKCKEQSSLTVVLADLHFPDTDWKSFNAALDYIRKNRKTIKRVILLGDFLDCQSISRHSEGLPGLRKEGGFKQDIDGFATQILDPIKKLVPQAKLILFEGNHEAWAQQFLEKMPELKGAIEIPYMLNLDERGWQWIPQGESYFAGKVCFIHGDGVGSSIHVAKKLVDTHCCTAVMGHVHTAQMHTKTSEVKSKDKWIGYTIPCMTNLNPRYGKGRPNSHIHGFGILEEYGVLFNFYIIIVNEGRFSLGGVVYGGQ